MLRIFIGYDTNETIAYHVLANSIMRRSSVPVCITPLILSQLPMTRMRDEKQSTDFAFSRFLVPWLCNYKGRALFMDCDMLCRSDLAELFEYGKDCALSVVQHDYAPIEEDKFLDQSQSLYKRKNWSSVMLFNNDLCRALTPEYVNTASGLELHQFKWLEDSEIGKLDIEWNYLVTEYPKNSEAKIVHFTRGTPCFRKYSRCDYSDEWYEEKRLMMSHNQIGECSMPERMYA